MAQYYLEDKEFGRMVITVRSQARSIIARWKAQTLHLTCPIGAPKEEIFNALDSMRPRLHAIKKEVKKFSFGQIIPCFRCNVTIGTHNGDYGTIGYGGDIPDLYINLHQDTDFSKITISRTISLCLENLMTLHAEEILIPYARQVANECGVTPQQYEIGRGKRKLGHCTSKKVIQLSRTLMFMPQHLVRYVICHELAHLTHMNHGIKFHTLCNRYCNGTEPELEVALKKFTPPTSL